MHGIRIYAVVYMRMCISMSIMLIRVGEQNIKYAVVKYIFFQLKNPVRFSFPLIDVEKLFGHQLFAFSY